MGKAVDNRYDGTPTKVSKWHGQRVLTSLSCCRTKPSPNSRNPGALLHLPNCAYKVINESEVVRPETARPYLGTICTSLHFCTSHAGPTMRSATNLKVASTCPSCMCIPRKSAFAEAPLLLHSCRRNIVDLRTSRAWCCTSHVAVPMSNNLQGMSKLHSGNTFRGRKQWRCAVHRTARGAASRNTNAKVWNLMSKFYGNSPMVNDFLAYSQLERNPKELVTMYVQSSPSYVQHHNKGSHSSNKSDGYIHVFVTRCG